MEKKERSLILTTDEEIRVMTDPYRLRIYHIFNNASPTPLTVKDVATRMDEPHGKVYYHIKKMLDIEALKLVREETIKGITAKYYSLAFESIDFRYLDLDLNERKDILATHIASMVSQTMDIWKSDAMEALLKTEENLAKVRALGHDEKKSLNQFDHTFSSGNLVFKDREEYLAFRQEITELLARYERQESKDYPFEKEYQLSLFTNTQQMATYMKRLEATEPSS